MAIDITALYCCLDDFCKVFEDWEAELSPNFGDGLRVQAAAVWEREAAGAVATSIPSVNLAP